MALRQLIQSRVIEAVGRSVGASRGPRSRRRRPFEASGPRGRPTPLRSPILLQVVAALPQLRGPWSAETVSDFLAETVIPMRIAVDSLSGWPLVLSVWFVADGMELVGAIRPDSMLARCLRRRPVCGFEVAADVPPYMGVRGRADVDLDEGAGAAILDRLLVRYTGSLDTPLGRRLRTRREDELCLRLRPSLLVSWDYRKRM